MSHVVSPLAITPGEPAGIGPDILLALLQQKFSRPLVIISDKNLLAQRAAHQGVPFTIPDYTADKAQPISILHTPLNASCTPGKLDAGQAPHVLQTLDLAIAGCLEKRFSALVTGPVHKAIIQQAGFEFSGHTGYLAAKTNCPRAVMLFTLAKKRLALVTTHIPLAAVPSHITPHTLTETIMLVHRGLQTLFKIPHPKLLITGLNPHAGEQGTLGQEEITVIEPTLTQLRAQGIDITGPVSADTALLVAEQKNMDIVISLYHDQLLPAFKTLGFGNLVNVTLGLPFVRTSVDHGTALDLAGTTKGDPSSLIAACNLAIELTQ